MLKRGDVFEGEISQTFTGTSSNRIVIDAYGTGGKPIIYGDMSFHTWTAVPGRVGYYKTWCGRTVETYGYEYYSGAWQQMTHQEGEIQFYLSNADSLRKFLDSFVASSYGPGAGGSDTIWVRTNDSNAPGQLHIFREGSFADGSYVTVQNLEFRNYRTALKALTGDHLIWRHIKTLNCMNEAMFLSTGTHDCLIDSCYCDSTSRTCIYNYFGSRNWFKYDTVNHEMDGVLGISQGGEQCGLGFESDNACGADHCLVENVIDSGVDTYLNLGDTVRYCTFIGMQGGIYLHGEQWVAHNNNIITGGDIGPAISVTLCKAGTVEQLGGTGQDHIYNNTINCFATGQGVESVFGTSATILFEHNDVTGQQSNSNLDKFDATTGLTSINNSFHSPGRFNATPYPNEVFYTSLSAFQAATGLESGSVWNSDASSPTGTLTITPSSFSFGNVIVNTISSKKTYTVQGSNLSPASGSIIITPPSGYQVSVTSGSGFGSSLNVSYTGSTLSSRTIYVRFSPTAVQSYTGNITNAGGGATTQNVAVTGAGISSTSPVITINPGSLAFRTVRIDTTSSEQTYTVQGSNLLPAADSLTITAPSGFTISTDSSSGFTSSKRIAYTGGTLSAKTIYVRFSPTAVQSYTGNITNAGGGATTQNVAVTGTGVSATTPALTVNPTSLSFGNVTINTISSELTYTLTGLNLSPAADSLTITAQSGFTISTVSGTGFTSSKRIAYTGGTLSAKTIYVRFTPTAVQNYNATIINIGGGAATQTVAISGSGVPAPPPTLTVSPPSLPFGGIVLNTSSELTYTLSGLNLIPASGNDTVTAPTGFQVSTTSGTGFGSSLTVVYSGGTLVATTIYVRFSPTLLQAYSGSITNIGGGATTVNVPVSGSGVVPAITVSLLSLPFGSVAINGSSERTYTLSGSNLQPANDTVRITAPTGFAVSTASSSGFNSAINLPYTTSTLSSTTIYVRFSPTAVQSYSGTITNIGGGASEQNVLVSGMGVSTSAPLLTTNPSLLSFDNVAINTISPEKAYTLSGSNLSPAIDSLTITTPLGFTISTVSGTGFTSSKRIAYTGGTLSAKTIYVRFTPTAVQDYSSNITNIGGGASAQSVYVSGSGVPPTIIVSPASLLFGNVIINTSSEQTYTLSGSNLQPANDTVRITAPTGFAVSTASSSGFNSAINLPYTTSTLSSTTIYVRFSPTAVQSYSGTITNIGGGASEQNVLVSGESITPLLTVSSTSVAFGNVPINTTSAESTFTIHGSNLTPLSGNIIMTAPSGFEVSMTSGSGFNSSINLPYTTSTLSSTTIYVRFSPMAVQSYIGNITNDGGGATTQDVTVSGTGVNAASLNISAASLSFGYVTINGISREKSYTLSGANLIAGGTIAITSSKGFQVSTTSGAGFDSSIFISYSSDTLSSRAIYVRFSPTVVENYNGNITNAGSGAPTLNVAVSGIGLCSNEIVQLGQNFPNPFNPNTRIPYSVYKKSWVKLTIFNILGQRISTLIDEEQDVGYYQPEFDIAKTKNNVELTSGVYFYRLEIAGVSITKKFLVLK